MSAPTVKWWQVTSGGTITNMNGSSGCTATQLTSSPLDFGNVEAGLWSTPQVFLVEFSGSTAQQLDIRMYDTDSNVDSPIVTTLGEDLFAGYSNNSTTSWNFHMNFLANWSDPTNLSNFGTDPASSPMNSWHELLYGASTLRMDTYRPLPGNDSTNNLLTANVGGDTTRHLTNFFIYISGKPRSAAAAGENLGFGMRLSFVYP